MPYSPLLGERCLEATAVPGQASVTVRREYAYPLNMNSAQWMCFCVCLPDEAAQSFAASVRVTWLDGTEYTASAQVGGDTWNAVICDISGVSSGKLAASIELTLASSDDKGFTAYFDGLGVSASTDFYTAMNCLTDRWYSSGGTLELSDDGTITFDVEEKDPFIETTALRYNAFTVADALRLRLINGAGCKSVTFYYTTYTSPDFSGERSRTVELSTSAGSQTVYLPVASDYIGQIRIVFNGELRGDIQILSLAPVSTYVSFDGGYAELTSCKVTSSGTVRIEGTLKDTATDKLRGYELYLYELSCWQEADAATLAALEPADIIKAMQSFAFEVGLYRDDGTSRVNSKFAVVVWRDDAPLLLDGYKYITNPEYLSKYNDELGKPTPPGKPTLIKGASPAEAAGNLLDSGTSQTVIEVSLPELMTLTGSGVTFTSDGAVYAADTDYVSALDTAVRRYTESGIRVYLRLTTSATGSASENRIFNHRGAESSAVYAAFNTETVSGVAYLRAACDFLASRYSAGDYSGGRVFGYIVGCNVESAYKYYNLGEASLAEFISAYGTAVRIIYNSVRMAAGTGAEVFVSTGSIWDADISAGSRFIYDGRSVIDALSAMFREEGDIGWLLAFDPYPYEDGYLACRDTSAGGDYTARRITLANIDVLCSYFIASAAILQRRVPWNPAVRASVRPCG